MNHVPKLMALCLNGDTSHLEEIKRARAEVEAKYGNTTTAAANIAETTAATGFTSATATTVANATSKPTSLFGANSSAGAGTAGAGMSTGLFAKPAGLIVGAGNSSATSTEEIIAEITQIYTQHAPDKLMALPKNLKDYEGREGLMLEKIRKKYGIPTPIPTPTPTSAATPANRVGGSIFGTQSGAQYVRNMCVSCVCPVCLMCVLHSYLYVRLCILTPLPPLSICSHNQLVCRAILPQV